jgi:hypothetical protein
MRTILSVSILIFAFGTNSKCQDGNIIREIELSKTSRAYQEHIRINADSLHVLVEDRKNEKASTSYSRKITKEEWNVLLNMTKDLVLKDLSSLPSPTMKRAYDGAMHATITIYTKDGSSYAHGYDDENPHEALRSLRKAIREISRQ